jgi:hypothetical protein
MNDKQKLQLTNLYSQKGELLTEMEIMQAQLQRVNQQIIQIKNALLQKQKNQNIDNSTEQGDN